MKSDTLSLKTIKKKLVFVRKIKLIGKMPDPCNAKEHYQSFI